MKSVYSRKWYMALATTIIITLSSLSYAMAPMAQSQETILNHTVSPTPTPTINEIKILSKYEKFISGERGDIKEIIWKYSEKNNLDPDYILGICLIETGGTLDPNTIGPRTESGRATGLFQLMPVLIKLYKIENPFDPEESAKAGTAHLNYLMNLYSNKKIYDENENLLKTKYIVAIAYNWGQGNIDKMLNKYDCIIIENLPYESRRYLKLIKAYCEGDEKLFKKLMN